MKYKIISTMKIFAVLFFILAFQFSAFSQTATPTPDVAAEKARADRAETRLRDWPNFGRYREANTKIMAPAKGEERVVFLGDSITDSWKLDEYFPGQPFINRGISGQTTPQMLIRFRPDVIDLKPRVVVILAGTNDISGNTGPATPETIQGNLTSIMELARANNIQVVISSVLPISDYNKNKEGKQIVRSQIRPPAQILAMNEWIKNYAAKNGAVYLDYFSAMVDDKGFLKEDLADDGLHPNKKGYDVMKPLAEAAIKTALKKKK